MPEYLYHYTSIETLALILDNRTLCFNSLANVDDIEEAETGDMANFGKYVYASCWTDDADESISLWKLYTPDMRGVRIKLPVFPFKKYHYKKGEFFLGEDIETYINIEKVYNENVGSIVSTFPKLIQITYTDNEDLLHPTIKECNRPDAVQVYLNAKSLKEIEDVDIKYNLGELGKYKRTVWRFQKEWRYIINIMPIGLKENAPSDFKKHQSIIRRLEDPNQPAPYTRFFLELDEESLKEMEILLGPRMTEAEQVLVKALLERHGLASQCHKSKLKIR